MKITKSQLKKIIKEEMEEFTGGPIDIEPLSAEEQEATRVAYYDLFNYLSTSGLPGDKPSDQLKHALKWIAKFNQERPEEKGLAGSSYEDTLDAYKKNPEHFN